MITEELKTFIDKMRAAGKSDVEIAAELKTAGWEEGAINQELSPKTRLNFAKVKFWLLLYGITILLLMAGFAFGPALNKKNIPLVNEIWIVFASFILTVLPIFTLLAILFGILNIILSRVFPGKNIPSISHGWLLVAASAISGSIIVLIGVLIPFSPGAELGNILLVLIPMFGMFWWFFSLLIGIALGIKAILRRQSNNRRAGWIKLAITTIIALAAVLVLGYLSLRFGFDKLYGK